MYRHLYRLPVATALQSLTRAPRTTMMISSALRVLGRETTSEFPPRFVSILFALSVASYLPRLAPYRCSGNLVSGVPRITALRSRLGLVVRAMRLRVWVAC
jgi:hypothetical protein